MCDVLMGEPKLEKKTNLELGAKDHKGKAKR